MEDLPSREEIEQLPADGGPEFNRLIFETSPYLLQHARNPVDWRPWGDEAFEVAREEDRPIFLSVGYSTCHWCHVMERESFEDPEITRLLNEHFVPVKVDREERPDVDEVYMTATQLMTGHGGWPNSVWLTPGGRPWHAGTYFPPKSQQGLLGFGELLEQLAEAWNERRDEIETRASRVLQAIRDSAQPTEQADVPLDRALIGGAVEALNDQFDKRHGGFGDAPKFPPHASLRLLLEMHRASGHQYALEMATQTLTAMARGGIHDLVGGGFHRYSTDVRWLVPHFEKMLYDNAQLAAAYATAHEVTGNAEYERATRGICEWVLREMTDPGGGFYSALDAESEGVEGRYYVWTRDEVIDVLGGEAGALACQLLHMYKDGNFRDEATGQRSNANIPHLGPRGLPEEELSAFLVQALAQLRERRQQRVRPARDNTVLAAWNGLMIRGLTVAGRALEESRYVEAAERAAAFVLDEMRVDGRLMRSWRDGEVTREGFLEDYAFTAAGLVELHEATGEGRWLQEAAKLVTTMLALFEDERSGGLFLTAADGEDVIARTKRPYDQAEPSGNGMAALVLVRLAELTGEPRWLEAAERALTTFSAAMRNAPTATGTLLLATSRYLDLTGEPGPVAESGEEQEPDARVRRGPVTVAAWASRRQARSGDEVEVALRVRIADGWHVSSHEPLGDDLRPTELGVARDERFELVEADYPEGRSIQPEMSDAPMSVYDGETWLTARVRVAPDAEEGPATLRMTLDAQACTDTECARPERHVLEVPLKVGEDVGPARHESVFERLR